VGCLLCLVLPQTANEMMHYINHRVLAYCFWFSLSKYLYFCLKSINLCIDVYCICPYLSVQRPCPVRVEVPTADGQSELVDIHPVMLQYIYLYACLMSIYTHVYLYPYFCVCVPLCVSNVYAVALLCLHICIYIYLCLCFYLYMWHSSIDMFLKTLYL